MHVIGLDHMVVNTHDLEQALHFYRDVLGLELLRLEEFRAGKVGFVSARVSPETIMPSFGRGPRASCWKPSACGRHRSSRRLICNQQL